MTKHSAESFLLLFLIVNYDLQFIKSFTMNSHLNNKNVIEACQKRNKICKSDSISICTTRRVRNGNKFVYKDFENICYLFLSNMCDQPGDEYYIVKSGTCKDYLSTRRFDGFIDATTGDVTTASSKTSQGTEITGAEEVTAANLKLGASGSDGNFEETTVTGDETVTGMTDDNGTAFDGNILREQKETTLYSIDESYDNHPCPHSCPNLYSPVCMNVNRGEGKYFKIFTFVNHCESDVFYCKHHAEFVPPPDYDEPDFSDSPLAWSFCGSYRYIQFARFSEQASSMARYGWLSGSQPATHIMRPDERKPGYG